MHLEAWAVLELEGGTRFPVASGMRHLRSRLTAPWLRHCSGPHPLEER